MNIGPVIVMISSNLHSGPGVQAVLQARALVSMGARVTFVCLPGKNLEQHACAAGCEVITDIAMPRKGGFTGVFASARRLKEIAASEKPQLILVHKTIETVIASFAKTGAPVVRVFHDRLGQCSVFTRLLLLLLGVKATATSITGACALGGACLKRSGGEKLILRGTVDTEVFCPNGIKPDIIEELKDELGISEEKVVIGNVSRWKEGRDLDSFLELFAAAHSKAKILHALMIGRGELRDKLLSQAQELGVAEHVTLFNPERRFVEAVQVCDFGCQMRPGSDGTSRAALEFMACGKPVILPPWGSLKDFALCGHEEETGAKICENDKEFVTTMVQMAENEELRNEYAKIARNHAMLNHSRENLKSDLRALLEKIDSGKKN